MKERHFLILILLASLFVKIPLAFLALNGLGVDESLYMSLAEKLANTGEYGIKTEYYDENFVVPLFPVTEALMIKFFGDMGPLLLAPIFSSLSVLVVYFIGKEFAGPRIGKISAVFMLVNPAVILLGVRPLTESMALFLLALSFLFFMKSLKDGKYWTFFLPLVFLTFITRYQFGGLIALSSLAYLIFSRNIRKILDRRFVYGILAALIVASPWIYSNYSLTGNPIGGPIHQGSSDTGFVLQNAIYYIPYALIVIGMLVPFMVYGIIRTPKLMDNMPLFFLASIFIIQFFVFGKVAEERYMLPILPFVAVFAGIGYQSLAGNKKKIYGIKINKISKLAFLILLVGNVVASAYAVSVYSDYPRYVETKQAAMFMLENCKSPVMSNSFTQIWYYTGFENIPYLEDRQERSGLIEKHGVSCVLVSRYESPYRDLLEEEPGFEEVLELDGLRVYKVL